MDFYTENIDSIVRNLNSDTSNGLSTEAIEISREKFGKNILKQSSNRGFMKLLIGQFNSPLVILLICASLASFYLGQSRDGLILIVIIVMNALIGFYQEWKSENILSSIKRLVVEKCTVVRDGKLIEINSDDLVPGDIVVLTEGAGIPADIRLISSNSLSVNEFILTGESLPSSKTHEYQTDSRQNLADLRNCVFMGTSVARGDAKGIVYATGTQTEIGKISTASEAIAPEDAPIQKEINDVAKKLTYATLIIGVCIFGTRILLHDSVATAIMFSVGVAAAMVPEGLPAQISMALALAVGRLAKRKAVVKKIASAQTLGSATVIASDKTGTITKNEMTITGCHFNGMNFSVTGLGYIPEGEILDSNGKSLHRRTLGDLKVFFLSGFLSSTGKVNPPDEYHAGWYCIGDPTEAAFATLAMKAGYNLEEIDKDYSCIKSFPFDSFRRRATIIRKHKNKIISFVKGSTESLLEVSSKIVDNGTITDLSDVRKNEILSLSDTFAENALRNIAIAYKDLDDQMEYTIEDVETNLIFAGFVTMFDPPHEEVKAAIESVFRAQIKVFMITGDNAVTAKAIAKRIGLMNNSEEFPEIIEGKKLQLMSDEEVNETFRNRAVIYSRVSPDDKYRIVDLLKKHGHIVAVTGDGVNDTLSLKRADIGVAMGSGGSKVAQEAANIVLLDDNFSTIAVAVKEGRTIFRNLEKTIKTNLSSNFAELTCVLAGFVGAFAGIATPILAVQILLIDMIGEMFPLIMLTYDPPEQKIMELPPRDPKDKILNRESMKGVLFNGTVMGIASYFSFLVIYFRDSNYEKAMTVTFVSVIFTQYANLLSRRTFGPALGKYLFSNRKLLGAFALSLLLTLLVIYVPLFNIYFHTAPLQLADWILPIIAGLLCLVIYELRKQPEWKD